MSNSIEQLTERFWSGDLTPEERKELLRQIDSEHPEWTKALEEVYLATVARTGETAETDTYFDQQLETITHKITGGTVEPTVANVKKISFTWWKVAAVLLPLAVMISFLIISRGDKQEVASIPKATQSATTPLQIYHLSNTDQQPESKLLADGTRVMLSPGCELTYTADYGREERVIELVSGQAFFDVAKDKKHPFSIVAGMVKVRALGTAFTVEKLNSEQVKVDLMNGRVVVHTGLTGARHSKDLYMKPGQQLHIDASRNYARLINKSEPAKDKKEVLASVKAKENNYILQFNQQSMVQVFDTLKKYYNIKIEYEEADMNGLWFTGSFKKGDTLPDILLTICKLNGLSYQYVNDGYLIKKK